MAAQINTAMAHDGFAGSITADQVRNGTYPVGFEELCKHVAVHQDKLNGYLRRIRDHRASLRKALIDVAAACADADAFEACRQKFFPKPNAAPS